ncbi:dihydrodipicolinate synthase family protein, partial [Streptomyces hydrogenans]|uniref:dihydrodipicolinate synthase family protein n=1 Tax=Streptomyces hydrogenans TaxID=1873719 RepID=UPI00367A9835
VVAGIGSLTTQGAIDLAQHAENVGADAIMLVPPFYDPLDFPSLKAFLSAVAGSISIPVMYYNLPGITGVKLTAAELAELGDIDGVDYIKNTSDDAVGLAELLAARTDRIKAFNGWDTLTFFGIASGAEASVWGTAGVVPELAVEFWNALAEQKDLDRARELWKHLWAISDFLESVNYVAGIKAGLELIGEPVGPARLPIQPLPAEERERFAGILREAGVLPVTAA